MTASRIRSVLHVLVAKAAGVSVLHPLHCVAAIVGGVPVADTVGHVCPRPWY